jgi:hypothetical protein
MHPDKTKIGTLSSRRLAGSAVAPQLGEPFWEAAVNRDMAGQLA